MNNEEYMVACKVTREKLGLAHWQTDIPLMVAHLPMSCLQFVVGTKTPTAWDDRWVRAIEVEIAERILLEVPL